MVSGELHWRLRLILPIDVLEPLPIAVFSVAVCDLNRFSISRLLRDRLI